MKEMSGRAARRQWLEWSALLVLMVVPLVYALFRELHDIYLFECAGFPWRVVGSIYLSYVFVMS